MSNGKICCLTGVCCEPGSLEQLDAWMQFVKHERPNLTDDEVAVVVDNILTSHNHFEDIKAFLGPKSV